MTEKQVERLLLALGGTVILCVTIIVVAATLLGVAHLVALWP